MARLCTQSRVSLYLDCGRFVSTVAAWKVPSAFPRRAPNVGLALLVEEVGLGHIGAWGVEEAGNRAW